MEGCVPCYNTLPESNCPDMVPSSIGHEDHNHYYAASFSLHSNSTTLPKTSPEQFYQQDWAESYHGISPHPLDNHSTVQSSTVSTADNQILEDDMCYTSSAVFSSSLKNLPGEPAFYPCDTSDALSRRGSHVEPVSNPFLVSPFRDCLNDFVHSAHPRYSRPENDQVNGYIKFRWAPTKARTLYNTAWEVQKLLNAGLQATYGKVPTITFEVPTNEALESTLHAEDGCQHSEYYSLDPTQACYSVSPMISTVPTIPYPSPAPEEPPSDQSDSGPGRTAKVGEMNRQLWQFYINNWCPGQSVLKETNPWAADFANMQPYDSVRQALQGLAGIYIYDYCPSALLHSKIIACIRGAEVRLSQILGDLNKIQADQGTEAVTLIIILSVLDVRGNPKSLIVCISYFLASFSSTLEIIDIEDAADVLYYQMVRNESRRKRPADARWLTGLRQAETILRDTNRNCTRPLADNAKAYSLRVSQSIVVARGLILADVMAPLPSAKEMNPQREVQRFNWLFCGDYKEAYQIHGGCGFSARLLHTISQITYCAARQAQEPDGSVVPVTTSYLIKGLGEMRQWSRESFADWDAAKGSSPIIEWVQTLPDAFLIESSEDMIDVTAEAWRLSAIIYLQYRLQRLHRSSPSVLLNLRKLAHCVRVLPTSGTYFTAQTPLFPIFLLGMSATDSFCREVAFSWFNRAADTAVRSNIPSIFRALQRICPYLDGLLEPTAAESADTLPEVKYRSPWWEDLVAHIWQTEDEALCFA